jgi:ABC-type polysaccharide/polyol phosphate transport system ATPase subunit
LHEAEHDDEHDHVDSAATRDARVPLVNNIEVIYDHVILVLKGVSLEVPQGRIVALLGANGAGKTTTLKAISNLLRAERGDDQGHDRVHRQARRPSDPTSRADGRLPGDGRPHCFST